MNSAASTGRTHGSSDQHCDNVQKTLANTKPSTHGTKRKCYRHLATSAYERLTDIGNAVCDFRYVPCVDGSVLARVFLNAIAVLVGAAMCSAC